MPVAHLGDIPLDDLNAEQLVGLLDSWATMLDQTGAPESLVQAMDLLSNNIEAGRLSQAEAVVLVREFLGLVESQGKAPESS
jgi:hypothetical protein